MKTLTILLLLISSSVFGEVTIKWTSLSDLSSDELRQMESWRGFQINKEFDDWYIFSSYDEGTFYTKSPAFDVQIGGIGAGIKLPVSKNIKLYGQVGYYEVDNSVGGRVRCANEYDYCLGEGIYYGLNAKWASTNGGIQQFNEYEVETHGGAGYAFGLEIDKEVMEDTSILFSLEYRYLDTKFGIHGFRDAWDYDNTGARWETYYKGIDSINLSIGLNYVLKEGEMDWILLIVYTISALCFILIIRNIIVFKCRQRALRITSRLAQTEIDIGGDFYACYRRYDAYGSYEKMLFSITKWTFNQFYPDIAPKD